MPSFIHSGGGSEDMVVKHSTPGPSPTLQRRIAEHRAEVARLSAELGEPEKALTTVIREHFARDALAAALREDVDQGPEKSDDKPDRALDR
jgi:hypothetical protein